MYAIVQTKKFTKSFKSLIGGGLKKSVQKDILFVIDKIANGESLEAGYRDHKLQGEFAGYRECHIQGDLLLIYKIHKQELVLLLVDLGSHNDLF